MNMLLKNTSKNIRSYSTIKSLPKEAKILVDRILRVDHAGNLSLIICLIDVLPISIY
jgi:hypothetical protein